MFIAGVARVSYVSLFSVFNNLNNISLNPEFKKFFMNILRMLQQCWLR
ncbi:MAG: AAA family ATPase [Desulfovibrionaceae bacterium]|nr:AAA family ATPase [Desulfovibrionaceae bacterium]